MTTFTESQSRTIAKVISWRVALTISHIVNAIIVTGSLLVGLQVAGLATIINSFLFWAHERAWNMTQWNRKENEQVEFIEGQPRTLSKIITWRILITFSNFIIPYIMTGSFTAAAIFAGLATLVNIVIFWAHDRLWNRVSWGKQVTNIS